MAALFTIRQGVSTSYGSLCRVVNFNSSIWKTCKPFAQQPVRMASTLFGEIFTGQDEIINMVQGAPGVRHLGLASDIMKKATQHLLDSKRNNANFDILQYGPRLGSDYARESFAKFLSDGYGDTVKGQDVVVTGGATNGLAMACTHFFKEGDVVFVEDPSYFIAIMMLKNDLKMKVVPVPSDAQGIDMAAYEALLEQYVGSKAGDVTDQRPFRAMLYLIPTYNNPRGYNLAPDRCRKVVELARKYDILNFSDDVYNLLHFDDASRAPPRLLTYDNRSDADFKGNTISNGTFAKILAPGLRLGWYETSPRIVENFRKSNILWSAGCTNHYGAELLSAVIDLGLIKQHIKDMNAEYKTKVAGLCEQMKESFPDTVKFNHIEGGYFIWIELPAEVKAAEVVKLALENKVRIMPGASCSPQGSFQNCLRLSISYQELDVLQEGIKKLGDVIKKVMSA